MLVDDTDPAILRLSAHFRNVIEEITNGSFKQPPPTRDITKDLSEKKKKTYFFTAQDCASLWRTMDDVETKWLGGRNISMRLEELKNKVILRQFSHVL